MKTRHFNSSQWGQEFVPAPRHRPSDRVTKTPNRATNFDDKTRTLSIIFLNVFVARENEEVC